MIPLVSAELAFRARFVNDLYFLPELLQEFGLQKIMTFSPHPSNAIFPLCENCQERDQVHQGMCWYCTTIGRKTREKGKRAPNTAILLFCSESIDFNKIAQAWQNDGDSAMTLGFQHKVQVQGEEASPNSNAILLITQAPQVGNRLKEIIGESVSQNKILTISIFPLRLKDDDKYGSGDVLAMAHHHQRYFPGDKTHVKFYPNSRHLASLDYAVEREMFLEHDACLQLFSKAKEIRQFLGKENLERLRKCIKEEELNKEYLFQKLLCLCTREQKEFLLTLNLTSLDSKRVSFWLELTKYVE